MRRLITRSWSSVRHASTFVARFCLSSAIPSNGVIPIGDSSAGQIPRADGVGVEMGTDELLFACLPCFRLKSVVHRNPVLGASVEVGCRVRLINDPGRVGVFTGRKAAPWPRLCASRFLRPDNAGSRSTKVELVEDEGESPIDLLRRGRLARRTDLYRTLTHIRLGGRLANFIYSLDTPTRTSMRTNSNPC